MRFYWLTTRWAVSLVSGRVLPHEVIGPIRNANAHKEPGWNEEKAISPAGNRHRHDVTLRH